MKRTIVEQFTSSDEGMKLFQQESLILEITELVCKLMEAKEINKTELAAKLNRSKGYITQLLNGTANMTIRTISDVMWALDSSLHVKAGPLSIEAREPQITGEEYSSWILHGKHESTYEIHVHVMGRDEYDLDIQNNEDAEIRVPA